MLLSRYQKFKTKNSQATGKCVRFAFLTLLLFCCLFKVCTSRESLGLDLRVYTLLVSLMEGNWNFLRAFDPTNNLGVLDGEKEGGLNSLGSLNFPQCKGQTLICRKEEVRAEAVKALRGLQSGDDVTADDAMDTTEGKAMPAFVDMVNYIQTKVRLLGSGVRWVKHQTPTTGFVLS